MRKLERIVSEYKDFVALKELESEFDSFRILNIKKTFLNESLNEPFASNVFYPENESLSKRRTSGSGSSFYSYESPKLITDESESQNLYVIVIQSLHHEFFLLQNLLPHCKKKYGQQGALNYFCLQFPLDP